MSSVGETLAAERRRQGKTIADVEAGTKVMGRMLNAIEQGRYEDLPSPVYVKGYLQSYAKFLGLEQGPILDAYKKETAIEDPEERLRLPDRPVVIRRDQMHTIPFKRWLLIVGALVVFGLIVWAISGLNSDDDVPASIPPASSAPETTETTSPGETSETVGVEGTSGSDTPATSFTMAVSVDEGAASWLRITVDGLNAYEGTLAGGQTKEWTVTDVATVIIGKPASVVVTRDGVAVPIETADGRGSVTLTAATDE